MQEKTYLNPLFFKLESMLERCEYMREELKQGEEDTREERMEKLEELSKIEKKIKKMKSLEPQELGYDPHEVLDEEGFDEETLELYYAATDDEEEDSDEDDLWKHSKN